MKHIFALLLMMSAYGAAEIPCPDFKTSILLSKTETHLDFDAIYDSLDSEHVSLFQKIYEQGIANANATPSKEYRIPRIVHQIWLGSAVPEKYREWIASWLKLKGWEYRLWTDKELHSFKLYNRDLYEKSCCYGEKSDIARLEILQRFGGVYVDIDYECMRPNIIDKLHRNFDFYIGIEPLSHGITYKYRLFKFCNAIIGSVPNHPLLNELIVNLKANYLAYKGRGGAWTRTGPSYLTRIICQYEKLHAHCQRNIYLPCTFLYPFSIFKTQMALNNPEALLRLYPEATGFHYWGHSWSPGLTPEMENMP